MASLQDVTRFICLFHSADRAQTAVKALKDAGIGAGSIQALGGDGSTAAIHADDLTEMGVPERDVKHLQEGVRKGGVLVSLQAQEEHSDAIEKIFHKYNADKIDETDISVADEFANAGTLAAAEPYAKVEQTSAPAEGEMVIPVAEETLQVGTRAVDRGGVRVLRHTVEEPVQQDVSLHGERVVLEYREVNRPATDADVRAGQQEIELIETAEVPVVEKVARVVEEVHVGKVATEHTETVRDSVRHTEVEVEDLNTKTGSTRYRD